MILIWGSNWAVMKTGLKITDPLNFAMQRLLLAALVLSPTLPLLRKQIPKDKKIWLHLVVLAIINAACMSFTNLGLLSEKSGISSVITYTQPLFVFVFAFTLLGEKISATRLSGIILGFCGVSVIYLTRDSLTITFSYAILFLLLGAFLWAVTIIYYKKFLSHTNPVITNIITFTIGGLLISMFVASSEGFSFTTTGNYLLIILYNAIGASTIAWTIWIYLIKEEQTITVSGSSLLVPMVALISGWILLGEIIDLTSVIGFVLVLAGVFLVNRKPRRNV